MGIVNLIFGILIAIFWYKVGYWLGEAKGRCDMFDELQKKGGETHE